MVNLFSLYFIQLAMRIWVFSVILCLFVSTSYSATATKDINHEGILISIPDFLYAPQNLAEEKTLSSSVAYSNKAKLDFLYFGFTPKPSSAASDVYKRQVSARLVSHTLLWNIRRVSTPGRFLLKMN